MKSFKKPLILLACFSFLILCAGLMLLPKVFNYAKRITRDEIRQALGKRELTNEEIESGIKLNFHNEEVIAETTINPELQKTILDLYDYYNPAYAAFVAMDVKTGKILVFADHSHHQHSENMALNATFPGASVFKLITSAAALEENAAQPESQIPFNGSYSSLYRKNIQNTVNHWTRFIRLEEALAKSVNTVFGKIAVHRLGAERLQKYANAFGFNQIIPFDMALDTGQAIVPADYFGLAESGSGYTKKQTLNPVQGALIAATIANHGKMPAPYLIAKATTRDGDLRYTAKERILSQPIDAVTASNLAKMMERTIISGTARGQYRDYSRNPILSKLFIAAKTGSISGENPKGRYDWFVGFAKPRNNTNGDAIAFASLIVNENFWYVKSSYLARRLILEYFRNEPYNPGSQLALQNH